ncbi:MAG TPA: P-II family nitrogen regulator [Phycisphaerales bacterium]|nr:P-II family nitrogen regulator [Phycisphaerales bacterium]
MKMILAFIKHRKFDDVMLALHKIEGLSGASSSNIQGFGSDCSRHGSEEEPEISMCVQPHIRLEIACHSELVDEVLSTITKAAHTGLRGDGKIYVLPLEEAVRISSGERGEDAV